MDKRIILNKYRYADAEAKNMSTLINLKTDKNIIREDDFSAEVNAYNIYLDERESCNTIRLTCQVNLMASNSLFNSITEIVKNEGSDNCECLNYRPKKIETAYAKPDIEWGKNINDCIQDTQITYSEDPKKNYTYHCGIDIFDNHILRSLTAIPNYYNKHYSDLSFNTINDFLMDEDGKEYDSAANHIKKVWVGVGVFQLIGERNTEYLHLYNKSNIRSFIDTINSNLIEKNGWLGFLNKSKMDAYDQDGNNLGISRVINNKGVNAFIELYPGKTHYTLMPYYNKARHRQEKNWEYCLTYPESSTKEGIPCINKALGTLKIAFIDESEADDDEILRTTIYSSCKHGLMPDDKINIYKSSYDNKKHELYAENVIVDSVIDEYTFAVYLSDYICENWISIFERDQVDETDENAIFSGRTSVDEYYPKGGDDIVIPRVVTPFNTYINADFDEDFGKEYHIGAQNLSFARVVDNQQVEYYVRIFSRFPNFDFMDVEPTEENIYSPVSGGTILNIDKYSQLEYEKQSTLSKLAFAKNIYGDDIAQIVFNDDINISNIKDNLGRPLTSLYLSFFKTNYGRKEWYNKNVTDSAVEHSHCFGKLNCGLELSPNANRADLRIGNIRVMNNIDEGFEGLDLRQLRGKLKGFGNDEISYVNQNKFYGDLCEYAPNVQVERVLQPIKHRFNTQQRELYGSGLSGQSAFTNVVYNEIVRDDVTSNQGFQTIQSVFDGTPTQKRDGYMYISNYEIPIRSFSTNLSEFKPQSYKLQSLKCISGSVYTVVTVERNNINNDTKICLYDSSLSKSYECTIKNILNENTLIFEIKSSDTLNTETITNYRIYKKPNGIPSYANVATDGSGVYRWRNLVQNGFESMDGIMEEYPFVNGCLYVNTSINIFVRRQDPFGEQGLSTITGIPSIDGKPSPIETDTSLNSDDSISENNAIC